MAVLAPHWSSWRFHTTCGDIFPLNGLWKFNFYILVYKSRGDQDVDGTILLRWIFRRLEGVVGTGWSWLRIGTGGGHLWVR